jgi:chemotaxis-related protein WspD
LRLHVHCKNCPVYATAAQRSLDRDLPGGYCANWARHFAAPRPDVPVELESLLVFRVGSEWLALTASSIDEVASLRPIHVLPQRRGVVLGVANVRGELLVSVSLARLLGIEPQAPVVGSAERARARLLVLRRGASRFAVPVEDVHGTERVPRHELIATPATLSRAGRVFTRQVLRWANKAVGCLDHELVFDELERQIA